MPNKPPGQAAMIYASRVDGRSPEWKYYSNIGHAKTAVQGPGSRFGCRGGEIWKTVDGKWELLYDVKPDTPKHALPWLSPEKQEELNINSNYNKRLRAIELYQAAAVRRKDIEALKIIWGIDAHQPLEPQLTGIDWLDKVRA